MNRGRIDDCAGSHRQGRRPWRWFVADWETTPKLRLEVPPVHHQDGRGFSLLEVAVAVAVMAVIMLGMGSAMLMAGRAIPEAGSPTVEGVAGAEAVEPIIAELQYAVSVNQRSERMIEFTVADRNGDGVPEVIRYEWSGVAGTPLTRQYNEGTAAQVLSQVEDFGLSYEVQTISTEIPQGNESMERFLIGYNSSRDYHDYTIKDTELYSEYFCPALPADTVSWKVTRVRFYGKQAGIPGGEIRIQLQVPTIGGLPSGIVLEEKTFHESLLPLLYLVQEVEYTRVFGLSPQQGLCLVFQWQSGGDACKLLGQDKSVTAPGILLAKSTNRAVSWSALSGQSLLFSIYGTVTTTGTPQIPNTYYLNAVEIRLRAGSDEQSAMRTRVRTLNRPEVVQ